MPREAWADSSATDLGSLERRVSELRVDVEARRKKWDYTRVSVDEAKRKLYAERNVAMRAKDDGRAARGRRATAATARLRETQAAQSEDEVVQLLRREVHELRSRRASLKSRLKAAETAVLGDDAQLGEVVKTLEAAATRRSAALAGDDADAPWKVAAAMEREAAAHLEHVRNREPLAQERADERDADEIRGELEVVTGKLAQSNGRLQRTKNREARWRKSCLEHVASGYEDEARYAATELGRVLRGYRSTHNAARHSITAGTRIERDTARLEALNRQDAKFVPEFSRHSSSDPTAC